MIDDDAQVRAALLDLESAATQVTVAQANVGLANETLTQARDRFAAGVTDNIEVIQAQQLLAPASQAVQHYSQVAVVVTRSQLHLQSVVLIQLESKLHKLLTMHIQRS